MAGSAAPQRVLFVCLGNICRSPLAEGVFRELVRRAGAEGRIACDSAGTAAYHVGEPPDARAAQTARRHGVKLAGRGRQVADADFGAFDLLLAMDEKNRSDLLRRCPPADRDKVRLLRSYDPEGPGDVPDPYYGGGDGFELVYAQVERSCRALLDALLEERAL